MSSDAARLLTPSSDEDTRPTQSGRSLRPAALAAVVLLVTVGVAAWGMTGSAGSPAMRSSSTAFLVGLAAENVSAKTPAPAKAEEKEEEEEEDSDEEGEAAKFGECSAVNVDCSKSLCCSDAKLKCYRKNQNYSACIAPGACEAGKVAAWDSAPYNTPWECKDITKGGEAKEDEENSTEGDEDEDEEEVGEKKEEAVGETKVSNATAAAGKAAANAATTKPNVTSVSA